MSNGLEDFSLFDLFRMEAEEQVRVLQSGLIELESGAATTATLRRQDCRDRSASGGPEGRCCLGFRW